MNQLLRKGLRFAVLGFSVLACTPDISWERTPVPQTSFTAKEGLDYVFDGGDIPEFHIAIDEEQWNELLDAYDKNPDTKRHISCAVTYQRAGESRQVDSVALRLKGNSSRRRPEGSKGQHHTKDAGQWHHFHFQLDFFHWVYDDDHLLGGMKKLSFKWAKDDPSYIRERYCLDLMKRFGCWTAPEAAHARVWLHVGDDSQEVYYGVYLMTEPIDEDYLEVRVDKFGSSEGILWKCMYGGFMDSLRPFVGADDEVKYRYSLKTHTDSLSSSRTSLYDFMKKLNKLPDEEFYEWIQQVTDLPLMLRNFAVDAVVGNWDNQWNSAHNFYLYFVPSGADGYKVYFIPYDYDFTLGSSFEKGNIQDTGRQNPFEWGVGKSTLMTRILKNGEFREMYRQYLLDLVDESGDLASFAASRGRIICWQDRIRDYVSNDTGEDCVIEDRPAGWGNHLEYRLLEDSDNWFMVKQESVLEYCL